MRQLILLTLMMVLWGVIPTQAQQNSSERVTVMYEGIERRYTVILPQDYTTDESRPLIMVLHGARMTSYSMSRTINLRHQANQQGAILVYPQGDNLRWNYLSDRSRANDVGFLRLVLDDLRLQYNIDSQRIFVNGYSNGGLMALRLACEWGDELAGVAIVAANYSTHFLQFCQNADPIPMLFVLGTEDNQFPWLGAFPYIFSIENTIDYLYENYECEGRTDLNTISEDGSQYDVMALTIDTCSGRGSFAIYGVIGAPHSPLPTRIRVTLDNGDSGDLVDLLWQFFNTHQRNPPRNSQL